MDRRGWLCGGGSAFECPPKWLGFFGVPVGGHGVDDESGAGEEVRDVSGEVTAAEEWLVDRLEAALTAGHFRIGGNAVLDEVEGAAGLEDTVDLGEGGVQEGNRAERPRRQDGVRGHARQVDAFTGEAGGVNLSVARSRCAQRRGRPDRAAGSTAWTV